MANADKTPVIYMWKNLVNGKVYIGSTKDLGARCKQYISAVNTVTRDPSKASKYNELIRDIVTLGWDKFEFKILDNSPELLDAHTRSIREVEAVMKYRSILPEYGYNGTIGGESGPAIHRDYKNGHTNIPRSVFLYDTLTEFVGFYLRGTLTIPREIGIKAAGFPNAIQRGNLISGRYFAYYGNTSRRAMFADYIAEMHDRPKFNGENDTESRRRYALYLKGLAKVDDYAKELGV